MFTTNKRLLCCKALNHGSEFKILWDTFRSQIAELWFPYDCTIADDRRRSQTIADDRRRSQTIADDRRSVFPYDRRRSQNFLRSAIRDPRSSAIIWKPALRSGSKAFTGKNKSLVMFLKAQMAMEPNSAHSYVLTSRGPFLESPGNFSGPESHSKISNLKITELFYSHIPNMNRSSLHTRSFRRIHFSDFKYR